MENKMAPKLRITLIVLFGLLTLGSSRPTFEDDESLAFDEEEARVYNEEESSGYNEALAELMSQYEEIRQSKEGPPRLLKSSNFCYGRRDGNYADFSNPQAFYMCDKAGQTWTMNCQAGLVFDQALNRCEWARGSSAGKQNGYEYQPYVQQQPAKEIYVQQQPAKQIYGPQKAPVQITGYGR